MKFTFHAESHTGRVRTLNEDCVGTVHPTDDTLLERRGDLLVIADGMGGHQSGEVASKQAIDTICRQYYDLPGHPINALVQAIREANAIVYRRAESENRRGMGTTVVAAARVRDTLYIAHVGDSRMYLVRDNTIQRLTEDHSLVAEQVAAGLLTQEEAERHPHRNVVSRAVGTSPDVQVEISAASPLDLDEGDVVILCSDGLTEHVKPPRILQVVQQRTPAQAARALIEAANAGGGSDNISVIVARVGDLPDDTAPTSALTAVSAAASDAPTAPLTPPSAPPPAAARGESPEPRSAWGVLFSILASVVVIALVGGLGFMALYLGRDAEPPPPTMTPENNLLVPADASSTPTLTATAEGGLAPAPTAPVSATLSLTPTTPAPATATVETTTVPPSSETPSAQDPRPALRLVRSP